METIKNGIGKPKEETRDTGVGKTIEYGVTTPCSPYDHRPPQGTTGYMGDSQMETRNTKIAEGESQKKKHVSSGKGQ